MPVCVDASFALKLVIPEKGSEFVSGKWEEWINDGIAIIAPRLFAFEIQSVLRRKVFKKEIRESEGLLAWETIWNAGVGIRHHDDLWQMAWEIARKYNLPTTYDATYLALSELAECELWTGDRRFFNSTVGRERLLRVIPD